MTAAIIYTGFLRTWESCLLNQQENLIKHYDCQNYFYTFEDPNYGGQFVRIPHSYYPALQPHEYDSNKQPETTIYNTLNMWHNLFVSFSLVPKGFDCYVRNRPDIKFSGKVELNNEPNTIYIPDCNDFRGGINDQFAYGCYDVMKIYFSLYLHYKDYYNQGVKFHPEGYLLHHLQVNGIKIVRTNINQAILRP